MTKYYIDAESSDSLMNPFNIFLSSLFFLRNNLRHLAIIILPIVLIRVGVGYFTETQIGGIRETIADSVVEVCLFLIYTAAVILVIHKRANNIPFKALAPLREALTYWLRLLTLELIKSVLIVAGLLILIVPGIFLAVRFSLAEQCLIASNSSVVDALRESYRRTTSRFLSVFLAFGYSILLLLLVTYPLSLVEEKLPLVINIVLFAMTMIGYSLINIVGYRIYQVISSNVTDPATDSTNAARQP